MSDTVLLILVVLGFFGLMGGGAWVHDTVMPALADRARRRHNLAIERTKLEREQLEAAKPMCTSCGHGLGFHQGGMACQADTEQPTKRTDTGVVMEMRVVPCKCTEYTGQAAGLSGSILRELDQ